MPKEVEKFETMGRKGHMILLDGINSGSAKVIVKLPQAEYKHVPEISVDISVLANLIIEPVNVNILVHDSVIFRVLQLKQGKLHEIVLGSQYYLEINNKAYAKIDGGLATGLALGTTEVLLRDRNVVENTLKSTMPKARLTVTEADKITLNLLPYYNWVTVENEKHEIALDLYTKNDERITLGAMFKIDSSSDVKLFKESQRNINGSRISGETIQTGTNPVSGTFNNVSFQIILAFLHSNSFTSQLVANAEMLIYGKMELTPRLVILPYDVNRPVKQRVQFRASGGDGSFVFSSTNPNLLTVATSGLAETHLDRLKDVHFDVSATGVVATTVKAAMSQNSKIFKTAEVLFLPPVKLQIVGFNLETALNNFIDIHVALFALHKGAYKPITACDNLQFDIEFSSQIFTIVSVETNEKDTIKDACRLIKLKGIHTGTSSVTISYRHGDELLKDDAQLWVHEPLVTLNPESNVVVLPVGSSRNVIYQSGPRKSYNVGSDLIKDLQFSKSIIDVSELHAEFQEQRFGFNVLCRKIGDTRVRLEIYNLLSQDNFIKNSAVIETIVHCVKPRFINLMSLDKLKTSCPIDSKSSLLHVRSMQDALDIDIEVLDQQKRKLHNISSLFIDFVFSQPTGTINHHIVYNRESESDEIDGVALPKRDFVRTSITEVNINHKIKAIVKDYEGAVLKSLNIQPESPVFGVAKSTGSQQLITPLIENELDFLSFDSSLLPFTSVSIFLAQGLMHRIQLGQGSGYYDIRVKNPSMLEVRHDKSSSQLVIIAKQIGETVIEIDDKCLKTELSKLEVSIVSVGRVELFTLDKVERTKSIEAIAILFDSNNHLVDIDGARLDVYQLNEKIYNERTLSIHRGHQENLQRGEIRYIITGNELGETKVVISSGSVSSSPATIQVFPPLLLIPRNATILVGSSLEITSRGGPKPDSDFLYQIENTDVLKRIDGSVVEGLKVGKTKITGKSVGTNPIDGSSITFTEDSIFVTVIPLSKVKIRTPLQRLKVGNVMPVTLWADAPTPVSPMVLGTLKHLKIHWQTDAPDVIELKHVFEDIGVIYGEADAISMRIRGLKQGKGRITATVYHGNSKLQASVDVTIFKTLELEAPKRIVHDPIVIPPRTSLQLKVNLDETVFEINDQADSTIINVSRDGTVKTNDILGTSLVVAQCGDQKLDIPIEIKNVNYIMATVSPSAQMKTIESFLPRDLNFAMSVSLHDNLGNEFSHSFEDLKWKLTNKNSLEVRASENFTLVVGLLRESSNVLAVSLRDSSGIKYQEDYVKLVTRSPPGIFNKNLLLTTGDIVCFDTPLSDGLGWQSFNSEVLLLHGKIGRVLAAPLSYQVTVHNGVKSGIYMSYELEVRQPDRVNFQKSFDIFNGETYRGFFTISNHQQTDKKVNLIANNPSQCDGLDENFTIDFLTCKLSSHDDTAILKKFETSPVFDKLAGSYACEIKALASLEEITSISRSKTINLQLETRLSSGIADKMDLKLTPAIQIFPRLFSIDKLSQEELTITGMENILQKVEVTSSHPDLLEIYTLPKTSGRLQFKVKLHNAGAVDSELFIRVTSPLTHQSVQIPILPPSEHEPAPTSNTWFVSAMTNIGKITAIIVLVLTSIAIVLMCQRNRDLDTSGGELLKSKTYN